MSALTDNPKPKTISARRWAARHPEAYDALSKRTNKRESLKRSLARVAKKASVYADSRRRARTSEIQRMAARGRAAVDIAIMLNLPMSFVAAELAKK